MYSFAILQFPNFV